MTKLSFLPRLALVLALLLPVWFLIASLGAKFGAWSKMFGFVTMTARWGLIMATIVALLAIIALIVSLATKPRRGWLSALIALAIPLAIFAGFNALRIQAGSVPFIYDITTNPVDAPVYSEALLKVRKETEANALIPFDTPLGQLEKWSGNEELANKTASQLIAEGYPNLTTFTVEQSVEEVINAVARAMEMRGFDNVTVDEEAGTIEGTEELFWFGFQDDVVARIRATETSTAVDFRSTSRLGLSDLGVNAERIADLSKAVQDRLSEEFPAEDTITSD